MEMEKTRVGHSATVALVTLLAGCAGSGPAPSSEPASRSDAPTRFDMLYQWELADIPGSSALEAIEQRRPRWLRGRGPSIKVDMSGDEPAAEVERGEERVRIYVDGIGRDIDMLDLMPVRNVDRIRFLSASEASTRFGIGHSAGAILVTTRNR